MIQPPMISLVPASPPEERTLIAQRRAAIEEISIARSTVIRFGLFGAYLFRPNPLHSDTDEVRESWTKEMWIQHESLARVCALLAGRDPKGEFPERVCLWIAQCAQQKPKEVKAVSEMFARGRRVLDAVAESGGTFEKVLIDHAMYGRTDFNPAIAALCNAFWVDQDSQRDAELARAQETGEAISSTLARLERIGRHVRLTSLNASVEAARVGDAGKGLGVIAQEFKSLAEEIQHLANDARENISGIIQGEGS